MSQEMSIKYYVLNGVKFCSSVLTRVPDCQKASAIEKWRRFTPGPPRAGLLRTPVIMPWPPMGMRAEAVMAS